MKIRKGIIPCGGMGTRFLPITKAVAKEMYPVIDTPVLAHIVKEMADSGIEEVFIILAPGKEAIKEYYTHNQKLEKALADKPELLETVRNIIPNNVDIRFGVQKSPRGSGDAVMCAREFTAGEPFCMSNGDDLIVSDIPVIKQLADAYEQKEGVILGVQQVEASETSKYGIIKPSHIDGKVIGCADMIEKPKTDPPSRYAALGRYVFTPEIFERIETLKPVKGEIQITDAIKSMMDDGKVYGYEFDGRRYDMGDKFGALTAIVDFALASPEYGDRFKAYIRGVTKNED